MRYRVNTCVETNKICYYQIYEHNHEPVASKRGIHPVLKERINEMAELSAAKPKQVVVKLTKLKINMVRLKLQY